MKGVISRADFGDVISQNNTILKKPDLRVNLSGFYSETAFHRNFCEIGIRKNFEQTLKNRKTPVMESFLVKKDFDKLCIICG